MPFIALCPHCRIAKVSAPKRKQGTLHTCPKCGSSFPLEPLDESALKVEYRLPPVDYDINEAYKDAPAEDFAAARTLVHRAADAPTNATPSEVLPLPAVPPEISKNTTVVQELDYTPNPTTLEPPMWLTLAAGGLFGLAMIATQFPYGRFLALPLLLVGGVLGFLAWGSFEPLRKKYGLAAIAVNVLGLILVLLLPDWLRMGPWVPEADPNAGPKPVLSVPRDGSAPVPAEWVDARLAVWQQDDVKVDVLGAKIEQLDPKAKKDAAAPPRRVLKIPIRVSNFNVGRAVSVVGWQPEALPKLALESGPALAFLKTEAALPKDVFGGKDLELVLVFDAPAKIETLKLELPGVGLGMTEPVKFTIPAAMIAK